MPDTFEIISAYKKADFEKRLYLFLECPELREDFIRTDQSEGKYNPKLSRPARKNAFRLLGKMGTYLNNLFA